jgi:hypothetical protein
MNETTKIIVVCAWCQKEGIGPPIGPNQSHGICPKHLAEMTQEIPAKKVDNPGLYAMIR